MTSSPWYFAGEFIPVFDPLESGTTEFRPTYLNVYLSVAALTNYITRIQFFSSGNLIGCGPEVAEPTGNDRHFP